MAIHCFSVFEAIYQERHTKALLHGSVSLHIHAHAHTHTCTHTTCTVHTQTKYRTTLTAHTKLISIYKELLLLEYRQQAFYDYVPVSYLPLLDAMRDHCEEDLSDRCEEDLSERQTLTRLTEVFISGPKTSASRLFLVPKTGSPIRLQHCQS